MTQFSVPWRPARRVSGGSAPRRAVVLAVVLVLAAMLLPAGLRFLGRLAGVELAEPVVTFLGTVGPLATAAACLLAAFIIKTWRGWGRFLQRTAKMILISAVVGTCVGVYLVNVAFEWITTDFTAAADDPTRSTWFGAALTFPEITAALPKGVPDWVGVLIWVFQYPAMRDLMGLAALFGFINVVAAYMIWWERKIAGRIQSRLGPMRVGGWHGWAQTAADGVKLVFKEDLVPAGADALLFRLAPYVAFVSAAVAFVALPFGANYVFRDLDVALVFILASMGIEVVGVIMAGWASNNKWSLYGAMREACQVVSYEIPMGLTLILPVVAAGSLNLARIADDQAGGWWAWYAFRNPFLFGGFLTYYVASLANCKRAPFDLPESESELVAGFHTEYSGFRWSLFFFAEYAAMFVVSGVATILYLGGWHSPLGTLLSADLTGDAGAALLIKRAWNGFIQSGPVWFVAKCTFLLYVQLWLRWTLPRIRIDQVLYACVQVMLPLTMALLIGQAVWVWADTSASGAWHAVSRGFNAMLGVIGLVFAFGFLGIAAYGFYHRRRLVGSLVRDPLPAG